MSDKKTSDLSSGIAVALPMGIAIGVAFGVSMDNIGMGIGFGVAIGIAMSPAFASKKSDETDAVDKDDATTESTKINDSESDEESSKH